MKCPPTAIVGIRDRMTFVVNQLERTTDGHAFGDSDGAGSSVGGTGSALRVAELAEGNSRY
jgi:hypothetical protein